eukprot:GILJ01017226.1.p1 GENE.GILJ01017226.1~~GILJ01017226.1.p1  ORF type:complete len:1261 (+),score=125.86 GILJ01017226.1:85-3783(+)
MVAIRTRTKRQLEQSTLVVEAGVVKRTKRVAKSVQKDQKDQKAHDETIEHIQASPPPIQVPDDICPMDIDTVDSQWADNDYMRYQPTNLDPSWSGGVLAKHPTMIVETQSMSRIKMPPLTFQTSIPRKMLVEDRILSDIQFETVGYACQSFETRLGDGSRAGFLQGDGTGVGKGRTISGILLEQYLDHINNTNNTNNTKPFQSVWVSTSWILLKDAVRDMTAVFGDLYKDVKVVEWRDVKQLTTVTGHAVFFTTYSMLARSHKETSKFNIDKIIQALNPQSFNGVVVFDESHNAKHGSIKMDVGGSGDPRLQDVEYNQGVSSQDDDQDDQDVSGDHFDDKKDSSAKCAEAVVKLQNMLFNAKILYASATGASSISHLAYMTRLGLWGAGTEFPTFERFASCLSRRAQLTTLELVAMELKAQGKYVSRSLSFHNVQVKVQETDLDENQSRIYNECVSIWSSLLSRAPPAALSHMWGDHQRFFAQMLCSFKTVTCIRMVRQFLNTHHSVVISLSNTGDACAQNDSTEPSVATYTLLTVLQKARTWPTVVTAGSGGQQWIDRLESGVRSLCLPNNAVDLLINGIGADQVAEISGRTHRFEASLLGGKWEYVRRGKGVTSKVNNAETAAFMMGTKRVAIITEAGSAGISLHSDKNANNRQPRVHIALQYPWSVDKFIQQCGRSHRSNQTYTPKFFILTSPVPGEKRFASEIANRLGQLGALTKGDRKSAHGTSASLDQFNFLTPAGMQALHKLRVQIYLPAILHHHDHWTREIFTRRPNDFVLRRMQEYEAKKLLKVPIYSFCPKEEITRRFVYLIFPTVHHLVKVFEKRAPGQTESDVIDQEVAGKLRWVQHATAAFRLLVKSPHTDHPLQSVIQNSHTGEILDTNHIRWAPRTHRRYFPKSFRENVRIVLMMRYRGETWNTWGRLPTPVIHLIISHLAEQSFGTHGTGALYNALVGVQMVDFKTAGVRVFFNRLLGLPIDIQHSLYSNFVGLFNETSGRLQKRAASASASASTVSTSLTYFMDRGAVDVGHQVRVDKVASSVLFRDRQTQSTTVLSTFKLTLPDPRMSWDAAVTLLNNINNIKKPDNTVDELDGVDDGCGDIIEYGFYRQMVSRRIVLFTKYWNGTIAMYRPNSIFRVFTRDQIFIEIERYDQIKDLNRARFEWETEYDEIVFVKEKTVYLLTGLLIRWWATITSIVEDIEVLRLTTSQDGERFIGLNLPDSCVRAISSVLLRS